MSWLIMALKLPIEVQALEEIPEDYGLPIIGNRSDIIAKIQEVVPYADFSNPQYGQIIGSDFVIEITFLAEEIDAFGFRVIGEEGALWVIADILQHLNLRGFDTSSGDFFDLATSLKSMREWIEYRNRVVRD